MNDVFRGLSKGELRFPPFPELGHRLGSVELKDPLFCSVTNNSWLAGSMALPPDAVICGRPDRAQSVGGKRTVGIELVSSATPEWGYLLGDVCPSSI